MFEIIGTIIRIFPTLEISPEKHYRTFWLRTDEFEPQIIRFQLSGAACNLLDDFKFNDRAKVNFSISGKPRDKNGKLELYNNNNVKGLMKSE